MGSGGLPLPGQPVEGPDLNFTTAAVPNLVDFAFRGISPPSTLYIQRDDILNIKTVSNQANEIVTIGTRILLPVMPLPGQPDQKTAAFPVAPQVGGTNIVTGSSQIKVAALRTTQFTNFQLMEGYLLSVNAFCQVATTRGQTFVQVFVGRPGSLGGSSAALTLFADYVVNPASISWPGHRVLHETESTGWVHSIQQANPGAGADWTFTAAVGQRLRISSLAAQLVTSATVANRNVELIVDDGANVVWRTTAAASVAAGTTEQFAATGTNVPTGVVTTDTELVIPPTLILEPGWRIRTVTTGIQAADQWSNIWLNCEEWLENL